MPFSFKPRLSVLLCAFAVLPSFFANAAQPNRIAASIDGSSRTQMHGTLGKRAMRALDLGLVSDDTRVSNITLQFSRTTAQDAALQQMEADLQNPDSPTYHKWLTPETYADQFGVSVDDYTQATKWIASQGFKIVSASRTRSFVSFSGSAAQIRSAFGTPLHSLTTDGETHFSNLAEPTIPLALANIVASIHGLNDFKPRPNMHADPQAIVAAAGSVSPNYTTGTGQHLLVPGDLQTIYDIKPLISAGINGTGVTIGIIGQTQADLTQVVTFRSLTGLPAKTITPILTGDDPGRNGDEGEAQLDLQWASAAAPNADIAFIVSTDVITSLLYAVDGNVAQILSMSYGGCEAGSSTDTAPLLDAIGQQANVLGITIVVSSGDSGATGSEAAGDPSVTAAITGLSVNALASSPHITSVGGTVLNEGTGTYWNTNNAAGTFSSALSYIPEAVWNDTLLQSATVTAANARGIVATGGGKSNVFPKPAWQTGTGVPADASRDQPDISLTSAVYHDPYLICFTGFCVNGFADSKGRLFAIGGTSAATPSFAGILALVEQKTGGRLGNINPTLYALANSRFGASVYHDITDGDNKVLACTGTRSATTGATNCTTTPAAIGYSANVGFDLATGWGSVDAFNLVNAWGQVSPLPNTGSTATTTTLTSPSTTGVLNAAGSFSVKVASASPTPVPTGLIDIQVNGQSAEYDTLSTTGTASTATSFTFDSSYFKVGTNTVVAKYLGDSTFAPSTSATFTVTIALPSALSKTTLTAATLTPTLGAAGLQCTAASISCDTATVSVVSATSGISKVPTGEVTFRVVNSSFIKGIDFLSATLSASGNGSIPLPITSDFFVAGPNTVIATYKGDGTYQSSTSSIALTVTAPPVVTGSLSLTPATSTVTVASGASAPPVTLTATSTGGYTGAVTFSASTTSSALNACYSFTPSSGTITSGGTLATAFALQASSCPASSSGVRTVSTFQRLTSSAQPLSLPMTGGATALAALLFFVLPRRRRWISLLLTLLSVTTLGMNGCGGSSSSNPGTAVTKTTPGTYTITVTATGAAATVVSSSVITFVVQ